MRKRSRGMSLVEILVVVGIMAILLSLVVPFAAKVYRAARSLRFDVSSPAFSRTKQSIPAKYAVSGQNISPPIEWTLTSLQAKTIVVAMNGSAGCGWILYNVPGDFKWVVEGYRTSVGGSLGMNDSGVVGYTGPAAPKKTGDSNSYTFSVYVLDTTLSFPSPPGYGQVMNATTGHVLQSGSVYGTFP